MKLLLLFDKLVNKIINKYRSLIFYVKTKQRVNLVGSITLINTNIKIGNNVIIYPNVMFYGDGEIEIGDNVQIGNNTIIYSSKQGGVHIGNHTSIAANCYIIDCDHGIKANELIQKQSNNVKPVWIGDDCWIATDVTILRGSIINDGAVVGAKSLVKGEILKEAIVVGIPCKTIKFRD